MDKQLDKFYTKKEIAKKLLNILKNELELDFSKEIFLEPSAGSGAFSDLVENVEAYDIKPEGENIKEADFLSLELNRSDFITIGNPPFGNRAKLSIEFFNKAAKNSKIIAMIFPSTFMKWSVQSQLDNNFKLVFFKKLEEESFTFKSKNYSVRTYFMIWVKNGSYENKKDFRIKSRPKISHPDFKIWQHNATENSRKYIKEDWEYATWRQGYYDYNKIFTRDDYKEIEDMVFNTNKQFFFIKPLTEESKEIILNMDFNELSKRNLSTPGFGKGDFVSYYTELKSKRRFDFF